MNREYKKVVITKKGENKVLKNHPWIFEGEIIKNDEITNGEIVDVLNEKEKYLGSGFYNNNSKITIRLLSRNTNDYYDKEFFKRRIKYAWDYRKTTMPDDLNCIRVIFGEADGLPGFTVDKFNDILVVQILSLGIDLRKNDILNALYEVLTEDNVTIAGVYERNDVKIRNLEGLEESTGWFDIGKGYPNSTKTQIIENEIKYIVDFKEGQKTGYFLDQKYNRKAIKNIAKNRNVLDCCTHTGSFAMNAYKGGAKKVTALDVSEKAINDSKENFKLNNMNIDTVCADLFIYLRELNKTKEKKYDFIILDPPAFTKSRKTINSALKGYQEINFLAMKTLPRGGYLATASCSHFASEEMFLEAIFKASLEAQVSLKLISSSGPSPDHPQLLGVEETKYLKFFIFQVV